MPPAAISTMLTVPERLRMDAIGLGLYDTVHRDSIDDVIRDIRDDRARAVVVSVACCLRPDSVRVVSRLASIVRDFPRVTAVAVLTDAAGAAPAAVLALGQCGVRTLIDARSPTGWWTLREALVQREDRASDFELSAASQLGRDLRGAPSDCLRFFTTLFTAPSAVTTACTLARALDVIPSTLISRFARRLLPSPKAYLAGARIVRAAARFEDPSCSVAHIATSLEYSSPQSFGRHLRMRLGLSPSVFRRTFDANAMLHYFRHALILPYLHTLRQFSPLSPPDIGRSPASPIHHRPLVGLSRPANQLERLGSKW